MGLFDLFKKKEESQVNRDWTQTPVQEPARERAKFTFVIQYIFTIKNVGVAIVGIVEEGPIYVGDKIYIVKGDKSVISTTVEGLENPSVGQMRNARPGENVAIMLHGIDASRLNEGDVVTNVEPGC